MSAAVFRAMLLATVRDRGALITSFILPVVFFVVFASILSSVGGEELRVSVALSADPQSAVAERFISTLRQADSVNFVGGESLDADTVRAMVRSGDADAGLVFNASALQRSAGAGAVVTIFADPSRAVAATMLSGIAERALAALANPRAAMASQADAMLQVENVIGAKGNASRAAYYAGAIAVMFLLFTTVHGAISLLEEGESGILDRVLAGPGGTAVLVNGKFLYLTAQGCMQVLIIFVVAWLGYGVDLPAHVLPWAVTTLAAAATAAALALALCAACQTKRQAQTISNVVILLLSALGGSMVPRFLMPPLLQDLGWITPNTWAIEAYTLIFWRDAPIESLLVPWATLAAAASIALLAAHRLARRLQYL